MTRRRPHAPKTPVERELVAESLGARGDAVAPGPVYVPNLLPGERARVAVRGERGRVVERLTDSPERVAPACPVAETCGGCAVMHLRRPAYDAWKRGLVEAALAREHVRAEVAPLVDAWGSGRRRAAFHALRIGRKLVFGFSERAGDRLADIADCPVAHASIRAAIPRLRALAEVLAPAKGRLDLAVTAADEGLDVAASGLKTVTLEHRLAAAEHAAAAGWARITLQGEPAAERIAPTVRFGLAKASPPPGGFLQATDAGEAVLSRFVVEAAKGAGRVIDLYAGSGAFALRLAEHAPVLAVEGDKAALAALRRAADHTPGLKPVETRWRDLALEPLSVSELAGADLVVIDPPRAGARAQAERLADADVGRIAAIACNPSTFARDARILIEGGWRMGPVTPVDQFAWTGHVEVFALFER